MLRNAEERGREFTGGGSLRRAHAGGLTGHRFGVEGARGLAGPRFGVEGARGLAGSRFGVEGGERNSAVKNSQHESVSA